MSPDSVNAFASRQAAWAAKQRAKGLCPSCGKPRGELAYCDDCARRRREMDRKRRGFEPWKPGGPGRRPKEVKFE